MMTAITIREPGGPDVLVPTERPVPIPGPKEILVAVAAAGVNRPDVMQPTGNYPPPPGASDIPGLEIFGVVAGLGAAVTRWRESDRVVALVNGGGYAEFCLAHETIALPLPEPLTMAEGAGIPETTFTVWHNVFPTQWLEARRMAARPRRDEWPRHNRTPARESFGLIGRHDRRDRRKMPRCGAPRRRPGDQLQDRRVRRGGARADRRTWRGRDPRHGRRRLPPAKHRPCGRGCPNRANLRSRWLGDEHRPLETARQAHHAHRARPFAAAQSRSRPSWRERSKNPFGRSSRRAATAPSSTKLYRSIKLAKRTAVSTPAHTSERSS
jgi:alcohol dehydrogenase-like protein